LNGEDLEEFSEPIFGLTERFEIVIYQVEIG